MAHLVKLVQARTLHLQRIVNSNPFSAAEAPPFDAAALLHRLEDLESRNRAESPGSSSAMDTNSNRDVTAEVRRAIQPDLDALTRAVRRYEKRATLQAFQTDTKLQELESRIGDAVTLAAAAASKREQAGFSGWVTATVAIPLQVAGVIVGAPFRILGVLLGRVGLSGGPTRDKRPLAPGSKRPATKGAMRFPWTGGKK